MPFSGHNQKSNALNLLENFSHARARARDSNSRKSSQFNCSWVLELVTSVGSEDVKHRQKDKRKAVNCYQQLRSRIVQIAKVLVNTNKGLTTGGQFSRGRCDKCERYRHR